MGLGQLRRWALMCNMGGTEPRPPRISGRDDAHNAGDGVNRKW